MVAVGVVIKNEVYRKVLALHWMSEGVSYDRPQVTLSHAAADERVEWVLHRLLLSQ